MTHSRLESSLVLIQSQPRVLSCSPAALSPCLCCGARVGAYTKEDTHTLIHLLTYSLIHTLEGAHTGKCETMRTVKNDIHRETDSCQEKYNQLTW